MRQRERRGERRGEYPLRAKHTTAAICAERSAVARLFCCSSVVCPCFAFVPRALLCPPAQFETRVSLALPTAPTCSLSLYAPPGVACDHLNPPPLLPAPNRDPNNPSHPPGWGMWRGGEEEQEQWGFHLAVTSSVAGAWSGEFFPLGFHLLCVRALSRDGLVACCSLSHSLRSRIPI